MPHHGAHNDGYRILVCLHRCFQRLNYSPTPAKLRLSILWRSAAYMTSHIYIYIYICSARTLNPGGQNQPEATTPQTTAGPHAAREIVAIWDLSPHSARKVSISAFSAAREHSVYKPGQRIRSRQPSKRARACKCHVDENLTIMTIIPSRRDKEKLTQ